MDKFILGSEDVYRRVALTVDDVAIDTSDFTEITVLVFHIITGDVIATLTFTGGDVFKDTPEADGYIEFIVARSDTADELIGYYYCSVVTQEADDDYESSIRYRGFVMECFEGIE